MKLYYHPVATASRPVVLLAADAGIALGHQLVDPMKGELLVPMPVFEREWARCQRFTLLASRTAQAL